MKYSYEKIEDNKSYVWHTEGDTKTLIAITDTAEKAHFLMTAANQFSSLSKEGKDEFIKVDIPVEREILFENKIAQLEQEITRLKGLVEAAFDYALVNRFSRNPNKIWQQFQKENGLK